MREKKLVANTVTSLLFQVCTIICGFILPRMILGAFGSSVNGMVNSISQFLGVIGFLELGVGSVIQSSLYKPLAENDKPKIIALVQLYKRIYTVLAILIFLLGMALYPFFNIFIKGEEKINYLFLVYLIFVIKNVISYLNAHKWSLINADQKGYVLSRYNLLFNVITTVSRIIILKFTRNYILYLVIELLIIIIQNI